MLYISDGLSVYSPSGWDPEEWVKILPQKIHKQTLIIIGVTVKATVDVIMVDRQNRRIDCDTN